MYLERAVLYDTEGQRPLAQADKHVSRFERTERLDALNELSFRVMRGAPGWEAYSRRRLIKLDYGDASSEWWRIVSVSDDGGDALNLVAQPRYADLKHMPAYVTASGTRYARVVVTGLALPNALTRLLNDLASAPDLFEPGEVDSVYQNERIYVWGEGESYWRLLNDMTIPERGGIAGGQLVFEWTGTQYAVHVREYDREEDTVVFTSLRSGIQGKDLSYNTSDKQYFSRIFAVGGPENETTTIAEARWGIDSASHDAGAGQTTLTLSDTAIWNDHVLRGRLVDIEGIGSFEIEDTARPNEIVVSGDATGGTTLQFREASGQPVVELSDDWADSELGRSVKAQRFPQVNVYDNLLIEAGVETQGESFAGWAARGNAVASFVTDPVSTQHGVSSIKVVGDARQSGAERDGLISDPIAWDKERFGPYVSCAINLRVISGAVGLRLIDSAGKIFPPESERIVGREDVIRGYQLGGFEPADGDLRLFVFAREDDTEFHIDAVCVTASASAVAYSPLMGPRALWDQAMRELRIRGGIQPPEMDIETFTITDMDVRRTLHVGQMVRVIEDQGLRIEELRAPVLRATEEMSVGHEADFQRIQIGKQPRSFAKMRAPEEEPPPPDGVLTPPPGDDPEEEEPEEPDPPPGPPGISVAPTLSGVEASLGAGNPYSTYDDILIALDTGEYREGVSVNAVIDSDRHVQARARLVDKNGNVFYSEGIGRPGGGFGDSLRARVGLVDIASTTYEVDVMCLSGSTGVEVGPSKVWFLEDGETIFDVTPVSIPHHGIISHMFSSSGDKTIVIETESADGAITDSEQIDITIPSGGAAPPEPDLSVEATRIDRRTFEFAAQVDWSGYTSEEPSPTWWFWRFQSGDIGKLGERVARWVFDDATTVTTRTVEVYAVDINGPERRVAGPITTDVEIRSAVDA